MGGITRFLMLALVIGAILSVGCTAHKERSITDDRFAYDLTVENGSVYIVFTKMPDFGVALDSADVEKVTDKEAYETENCCSCSPKTYVKEGKPLKLSCFPKEPGLYLLRFKLSHTEPASYKPSKGETCLKYSDGHWQCEIRGSGEFEVK